MDSSSIKPEQLRTIKSLSRCTEEERMAFLEFVELVPCAKGVLLIQEGDEGDCMYFIVAGEMRVFTRKKNGQELTLKMLGAGDAFGDVALFHGSPRMASVDASSDSQLLKLTSDGLDKLRVQQPGIAAEFLHSLATSLSQMYRDFH